MNILLKRIFLRSATLHEIYDLPNCLSVRWYSSTTKQEFGRHFEAVVVQSLRKYSFDVAVCGGPKDRGIDFRGVWRLKASSVRVIGQCKRYKRRLGPKHVRELEGTLTHEAKGTLGIIVTECGYSKDAYGVFMGSLYPIALTTLKGYSDELLQWYFDQENDEKCDSKTQDTAQSDSANSAWYRSMDVHSPRDTQIVCGRVNSSRLGMNDDEVANTKEVSCLQQYSATVQEDAKSSFSPNHIRDVNRIVESNISLASDQSTHGKPKLVNNGPLTKDFEDMEDDFGQLTNSNISDIESGVFTMFELNPAARRLLPNLVVGVKYRRRNSKAPELFINEDDSFVSIPE
ncbi:hypothetical protein ACROYT_G027348 [Oculina patagonica]